MSRPTGEMGDSSAPAGPGVEWSKGHAAAPERRIDRPLAPTLILLKMALVLAGLGFLLAWARQGLPSDRPPVSVLGVLLALVLNQAALYAAALRLRGTLAAFDIRLNPRQALSIHLRSLFYFFFVPMSVGYEITRYLAVRRIDPNATVKRILFALLMDRVLGLFAALFAVAILAPLVLPVIPWPTLDPLWLLPLAAVAGIIAAFMVAQGTLGRRVREVIRALGRSGPRLIGPALLSLTVLALVCASVIAFAEGSGLSLGWATVSFALSASLLGMAVPLSLLGVTLGEAAGAGTLAALGLSSGAAVLLASVAYSGRLLGAMQGAVIELLGDARRIPRQDKVGGVR